MSAKYPLPKKYPNVIFIRNKKDKELDSFLISKFMEIQFAYEIVEYDLSKIETPYIPTLDEVAAWAAHLAYCQFTEAEMRNGTAWKILNESKDNNV